MVNPRFANEVTRLRKYYLEEVEKEFIYSGKFNMEEVTVNAPRKIQINK